MAYWICVLFLNPHHRAFFSIDFQIQWRGRRETHTPMDWLPAEASQPGLGIELTTKVWALEFNHNPLVRRPTLLTTGQADQAKCCWNLYVKNENLSLGILDIRVLISGAIDQQVTSCGLRSLAEGRVFAFSSFVPGSRSDCVGVVRDEGSFGNSCIKSF